jgi:prepilin-type N-terminal cleavage/methylation domain-containing protein
MMGLFLRRGFTLVEIMIVVAIMAILLSVALPNYLKFGKTAAKNACILNLRQIDGAMEQWAIADNIPSGAIPGSSQGEEIYNYVDGGIPTCPSGGEYSIHAIGSRPQVTCSREDEGHKLPN